MQPRPAQSRPARPAPRTTLKRFAAPSRPARNSLRHEADRKGIPGAGDTAAGRAAEGADWVKETGRARRPAVRGPRRRRQGRHHQAFHGAHEPAHRPGRRAGEADRARAHASGTFSATSSTCPSAGEMVLFDRSWYNRAGVERVMGFCSPDEYLEFMRQCPELERMLVRSGIQLFKYWFSVSPRGTAAPLRQPRETDPLKQWKLSPIDRPRSTSGTTTPRRRRRCSSTPTPPTPRGPSSSRTTRSGRGWNACGIFCHVALSTARTAHVVTAPDPLIVGSTAHVIGRDSHILGKSLHPEAKRGELGQPAGAAPGWRNPLPPLG